jgi:hypothetical protein
MHFEDRLFQYLVNFQIRYINARPNPEKHSAKIQGWAKLVLIALERYSVELKRLTFNLR